MIRARIVAEGRVQKVGYRDLVQSTARKLGVKGYVENLKDENVQIICEAEEGVLENFVRKIKVKEDFIEVEGVQVVEKSEATGEFEHFEIKYGRLEEEFGERMGTAIEYAKAMRGDIQSMHKDMRDMHKDLRDEIMGVRSEVKDMHVDMNRSFDEMAKRYDAISSELVRTREELTRAVNGLLKLIEEFIHERRGADRTER